MDVVFVTFGVQRPTRATVIRNHKEAKYNSITDKVVEKKMNILHYNYVHYFCQNVCQGTPDSIVR